MNNTPTPLGRITASRLTAMINAHRHQTVIDNITTAAQFIEHNPDAILRIYTGHTVDTICAYLVDGHGMLQFFGRGTTVATALQDLDHDIIRALTPPRAAITETRQPQEAAL